MARVYWVTESGVFLSDENGNRLVFEAGDAPPPEWLAEVLRVRFVIGDPAGSPLIFAAALPAAPIEGMVCTAGNGVYRRWRDGAWETCPITLDDQAINGFRGGTVWERAKQAIALLLIRINPLDYITSGNAGGQSVSFPSLESVAAFFKTRQEAIDAQIIASGGANRVCVRPYPVGGVYG
jgi:hypothetical protein